MRFSQAVKEMRKGHLLRRPEWKNDWAVSIMLGKCPLKDPLRWALFEPMFLVANGKRVWKRPAGGQSYRPTPDDVTADDWYVAERNWLRHGEEIKK